MKAANAEIEKEYLKRKLKPGVDKMSNNKRARTDGMDENQNDNNNYVATAAIVLQTILTILQKIRTEDAAEAAPQGGNREIMTGFTRAVEDAQ